MGAAATVPTVIVVGEETESAQTPPLLITARYACAFTALV